MTAQYAAASEIFLAVCELPLAERDAYLDAACRGDSELRAEVLSLLAYDVDPASIEPDAPPHEPLAPGALFAGRYRVVAQLGRGSTGVVYRAVDERLAQTVALKVLRTSSPARREQLAREVRLARQVTHRAVCRVYDFEEAGHECFLTMELVDGENLATLLLRVGRLAPARVLAIAREVLDGLDAAHASGVLHRDLKPANLLMDASGSVVITDFGIATGGEPGDAFALPAGTPAYMAPEQRSGAALAAQTDLYSLAVVLYELITGMRPASPPEPPARRVPDVDPLLERAILCALERDPARRPSSARVMLGMLRAPETERAPGRAGEVASLDPEQRPITALFVSRNDSTEFAPDLAPEELQEVLSAERSAIRAVVERHGGLIAQQLGGDKLVLFGFPVAREDAPARALAAALEIREAVAALDRELRPRLAAPISVRAGLHTGTALLEVPEGETGAYAYGAIVDAVAALAARARPGQVLASAALHERLGGAHGWIASGELRVPGTAQPVSVFEVRGESVEVPAPRAPVAPFVGREHEIALLVERFQRAAAGEGQLVLVRGESGVGKSRLLQQVRARLAGEPHRWLQAQCTPYTANTPLYPYSQILAEAAELAPGLPAHERRRRLREMLAAYQIERPDLLPPLERLLALRDGSEPMPNPSAQRDAAFAAIFAMSKRVGERHPLVFVLEDLHWADPSSLEMLRLAHAVRSELRVLLVCTMRPELELTRPASANALEIELGPLAPDETRRIAQFHAGGQVAGAALDAIVERAQGNPLFAGELARHAREAGRGSAIPASLHDSLLARLDRLGDEKRIAQVASVFGRWFSREALRILSGVGSQRELDDALHQLEERQLIGGVGLPPGSHYEFRHALIRDAAYESIPPRRRAALHAQAAHALETAHPEWSALNPEVLAHHHESAAQPEHAAAGWERAADRALETAAHVEAERHLERALASAAQIPASRSRDERELRLLLKLGRALLALRGRNAPEVERTYARAHALCRAHEPSPSVFAGLSEIGVHCVAICDGRAFEMASELVAVANQCGDARLEALAEGARAQLLCFMGRHREAFAAAARAHAHLDAIARDAGVLRAGRGAPSVDALSAVHVAIARSAWLQGQPDRARREAKRALEVARALGEPYNVGITELLIAYVHLWCGEDDRALELAEANLTRAARFGYGLFEASALGIRSEVRLRAGWPHAALEDKRAELELRHALGTVFGSGLARLQFAQVLARVGELEAAIDAAREAVRLSSLPDDCALLAESHRILGVFLLRRDRAGEEGHRELAHALAIAREQDALSLELRAALAIARSPRADFAPLRSAYARFREGFDTADLMEARAVLDLASASTTPLAS